MASRADVGIGDLARAFLSLRVSDARRAGDIARLLGIPVLGEQPAGG
jgi:hypothetical protein